MIQYKPEIEKTRNIHRKTGAYDRDTYRREAASKARQHRRNVRTAKRAWSADA